MNDGFRQTGKPLDALDRRILVELQRDCSLSAGALAQRCGTTESTALRRWKRLIRDGVILGQIAIIDPAAAGRPLQAVVLIKINRKGPANTLQLIRDISRHPAVTHFYHVTGEPDYVALLSVRSMDEYEDFVMNVLAADPRFATQTMIVIKAMKSGQEIAVTAP